MERIATLRAWLAEKPDDRFAAYALALELEKAGDLVAAEIQLRRLLERHPGSGAGHLRLGRLLVAMGRAPEAEIAWRAGLVALAGVAGTEAKRSIAEIEGDLRALEEDSNS